MSATNRRDAACQPVNQQRRQTVTATERGSVKEQTAECSESSAGQNRKEASIVRKVSVACVCVYVFL